MKDRKARLISSQRFLDESLVKRKMRLPAVLLVVEILDITLRGTPYRMIVDGHHAMEAAKRRAIRPVFRRCKKKLIRSGGMSGPQLERFLINNLTDSDWYDVHTGEVVTELLGRE